MVGPSYTTLAVILHRLVAPGILGHIALAWIWSHLADHHVRPAINLYKSIENTIFGLLVWPHIGGILRLDPDLRGRVHNLAGWYMRAVRRPFTPWLFCTWPAL